MPIEWGEEARIKTRQRQRRLHMLAQEGRESASSASRRTGGGGEEAGVKDSRSTSRVPWLLLDELDAEKQKLMASCSRLHDTLSVAKTLRDRSLACCRCLACCLLSELTRGVFS